MLAVNTNRCCTINNIPPLLLASVEWQGLFHSQHTTKSSVFVLDFNKASFNIFLTKATAVM